MRNDDVVGNRQLPGNVGLRRCTISAPNFVECAEVLTPFSNLNVVSGPHGLRFTLIDPEGNECREVDWQV